MTTEPDDARNAQRLTKMGADPRFRQLFPSKLAVVMRRSAEACRADMAYRQARDARLAALGGDLDALIDEDTEDGALAALRSSVPTPWYRSEMREARWVEVAMWLDVHAPGQFPTPWLGDSMPSNGLSGVERIAFFGELAVARGSIEAASATYTLSALAVVEEDIAAIDRGIRDLKHACRAFTSDAELQALIAVRNAMKRLRESGWGALDEFMDLRELLDPLLHTPVGTPLDGRQSKSNVAARAAEMIERLQTSEQIAVSPQAKPDTEWRDAEWFECATAQGISPRNLRDWKRRGNIIGKALNDRRNVYDAGSVAEYKGAYKNNILEALSRDRGEAK